MKINDIINIQESLADEFMAMAKAKGMNPRLRGTPDEERARTDAMLKQRAADRANAPKPAGPDAEERANLEARLKELEAKFDPDFEYSDDHSFWTKQHELSKQIGAIKHRLAQESVEEEKQRLDPKCWDGYKKQGTKLKGGVRVNNCVKEDLLEETYDGDEFYEAYGELWYNEDEQLDEAEYQGRKVPLGKPMRGDVKKFKVYVKDPKTGNVKKVNFGDPNMKIKKSNPARRKSFRARHNCANPGPRTKARYWSCRKW